MSEDVQAPVVVPSAPTPFIQTPMFKVLVGIGISVLGGLAGWQISFTGPASATASPAPQAVQYVPPKVEMMSKADVQVLVDQTAKATVSEVMTRVDSMRAADMQLINAKLDSIETKVNALGPAISTQPR